MDYVEQCLLRASVSVEKARESVRVNPDLPSLVSEVRAGAAESAADFVAALRGDGLHPDDAASLQLVVMAIRSR